MLEPLKRSESVSTQSQAAKALVRLVTRFPGLRPFFIESKHVRRIGTSEEDILGLWDPSGDRVNPDVAVLDFLRFGAACVATGDIAVILEETSRPLWSVTDSSEGISVIERLVVATDCG